MAYLQVNYELFVKKNFVCMRNVYMDFVKCGLRPDGIIRLSWFRHFND